jgi:polysaccharide biosynthesis protein VpsM
MKHRGIVSLFSGIAVTCGLMMVGNAQAMQINKLALVAANEVQPAVAAAAPDMPMGQSAEGQPSLLPENAGETNNQNLFGLEGGYIHPYITIKGEYTDNLYNLDTNKTSNFLTTLSPGIWFALPRKKEIPITITPHNSSAGGLQHQLKDYEGTDRYLAYALGGLDFKYYSEDSNLNTTDGILEGLFRYNMRGGLSLQLIDRFTHGEDRFDIGSVPGVNEGSYKSNIIMATADWRMTEKLRLKLDYSNFTLNYDENIDAFKTRVDNALDLYGYYVYSVKTSFFIEDKYIDVSYDTASEDDNKQNYIYGGIDWKSTEKLSFLAKAGLQKKNYDNNGTGFAARKDYSGLALDLQTLYKFSEKTKFSLDIYRMNEETDSTLASGKQVLGATFGYKQKFTDKLSATLGITYEDADYAQLVAQKRDDKRFAVQPAVQYLFREWLLAELSYTFERRDSTDDLFDYQTNTIMADLKFAL